jgi:hypothetical protein
MTSGGVSKFAGSKRTVGTGTGAGSEGVGFEPPIIEQPAVESDASAAEMRRLMDRFTP